MTAEQIIETPPPARAKTLDIRMLIGALRRRWKLFAAIVLFVTAAVLATTFLLKPVWSASAYVLIEPNRRSPVDVAEAMQGGPPDQAIVDTEVQLMSSRDVLTRVVEELGLDRDPEFRPPSSAVAPVGREVVVNEAVAGLQRRLSVAREGTTYLVGVQVSSADPAKAAAIANAVAGQYIRTSMETRAATAGGESQTLGRQLQELGQEVQAAEARVAQYRSQSGIVEGGQSGTITDQQVAPLSAQLATADARAAASQSSLNAARAQVARGALDSVSGVLESPVIADLRRQRAEILRRQGEIERYLERHPERRALEQQRADIDRQLGEEANRIVAGLESQARADAAGAARLRSELARLRAQQAVETRATVTASSLEREAEARRTVYNQLAQTAQQAAQQRQAATPVGRVVGLAEPPLSPSFPNKPLFAVLGVMLGLLAGVAAVGVAEAYDVRIRSVEDVEEGLHVPYLGSIPHLSARRLRSAGVDGPAWDYLVARPMSAYAEAFRNLRSALFGDPDNGRMVAITSALPGEGKSTAAASLAQAMAMSGDSVVIVDGDLRHGSLAALAPAREGGGLAEVIEGKVALDAALVRDERTGLVVLPLAGRQYTARDLFGSPAMAELLDGLRQRFTFVLIDAPPLLAVAEARTLASLADSVMMVAAWNRTSRFAAQAALARLRRARVRVPGLVLSQVQRRAGTGDPADSSYYSSKYAHYYQND